MIKTLRHFLKLKFKSKRILASIYYTFFSRNFGREQKAVLAGKLAYEQSLKEIGETSVLLRRNIHKLEKGLIMQPRRDVFGEGVIGETVKIYEIAIKKGNLNTEEKKWFTDVLTKYFTVVKNTNTIMKVREKFEACVEQDNNSEKFIPYTFDTLPELSVNYEQLHKLFLKRRSVRWYKNKDVSITLIDKAVNLATLAPSACNRQPYSFYVSKTRKKAVEMALCAGGTPGWAKGIPCTIAIIGDLSAYPRERDRHLIYVDGSLASMQLMLALETLGLSTCPINWPDIEREEKKMATLLKLKPYERPVMLLSVGYALNQGGIAYSQKKNANTLIKQV
ncbi:nitroreductase family protein [Candidatus Pelagibacter sp.]|nr:nitroreductase family protein [Candidatus Pelagibacter sp.]MDC1482762.1 nitroreductase family protein [Pelagibacteraceae bacterium]|tara:strand:+ start:430 stop:1434 length:1005 start_codon:yes stop_codon:yes gene_type:complete